MTFGEDFGWSSSEKDSEAIIDRYIALGGNFIDTANMHTKGHSEKIIGDNEGGAARGLGSHGRLGQLRRAPTATNQKVACSSQPGRVLGSVRTRRIENEVDLATLDIEALSAAEFCSLTTAIDFQNSFACVATAPSTANLRGTLILDQKVFDGFLVPEPPPDPRRGPGVGPQSPRARPPTTTSRRRVSYLPVAEECHGG
jgi:hypothetical protein